MTYYTGFLAFFSGLAITASPMQVQAANYGGFGSTYSEVINPKDSVLNDETVGSEDVKSGLASLSEFKATIKTIQGDLVSLNILKCLGDVDEAIFLSD